MKKITELDVKKKNPEQVLVDLNDPQVAAQVQKFAASVAACSDTLEKLIADFKRCHADK